MTEKGLVIEICKEYTVDLDNTSEVVQYMISEKMKGLVKNSSVIRAMFEEGKRLSDIYGKENVYDFSLGNPNVPAPPEVNEAIKKVVDEEPPVYVHGYMSNSGYEDVREAIALSVNRKYGTEFGAGNIIMTVGAAGGMNVFFKAFVNPGDEIIAFAPYFGEYRAYAANADAHIVEVRPDKRTFQPDIRALEEAVTEKTRVVIINTPNNPTGVIYSEETIRNIAAVLEKKQKEFNTVIALFSDEPYRELAYDGVTVPYVTRYYSNTIVGYSYSKSLSLPGERIGYIIVPQEFDDYENVAAACNVATRILGFVNAPSLMQRVIARCTDIDISANIEIYNRNREALYKGLSDAGYECVRPEGAFYMFVKTPGDDVQFAERAKKYNILVVPGSSFGCAGYVRIAYCVAYDTIIKSLPFFAKLRQEYEK